VTQRDPKSHRGIDRVSAGRAIEVVRDYATNKYVWSGLAVLVFVALMLYVTFNYWIMPAYTRHGESVTVPDVINTEVGEALDRLDAAGLRTEQVIMRKPNLPRGVVIDQNPEPLASVKPGRRIYLSVNSGDTALVSVPRVLDHSIREARNRIMIQGLTVEDVRPDSIPSAHANTITRQSPEAGERVPQSAGVTLWYSTGLGDRLVTIPSVVGMTIDEARERLLEIRLRSVAPRARIDTVSDSTVACQSPAEGATVLEGFEIRLYLSCPDGPGTTADTTGADKP
jgi:beta-lactam-binding protein with PASTA domain